MKVKITQKFIYHKVATVEVEVDEAKYQDWIKENNEEGANPSSRWSRQHGKKRTDKAQNYH